MVGTSKVTAKFSELNRLICAGIIVLIFYIIAKDNQYVVGISETGGFLILGILFFIYSFMRLVNKKNPAGSLFFWGMIYFAIAAFFAFLVTVLSGYLEMLLGMPTIYTQMVFIVMASYGIIKRLYDSRIKKEVPKGFGGGLLVFAIFVLAVGVGILLFAGIMFFEMGFLWKFVFLVHFVLCYYLFYSIVKLEPNTVYLAKGFCWVLIGWTLIFAYTSYIFNRMIYDRYILIVLFLIAWLVYFSWSDRINNTFPKNKRKTHLIDRLLVWFLILVFFTGLCSLLVININEIIEYFVPPPPICDIECVQPTDFDNASSLSNATRTGMCGPNRYNTFNGATLMRGQRDVPKEQMKYCGACCAVSNF